MNTKITLLVTGLIAVVSASTIARSIGPVYAPITCARCGATFAPGLQAQIVGQPAFTFAPGNLAKVNGLPAQQFAPGQQAKVTPDN